MADSNHDEYASLLNLWSSGIRDYHSLFSAYLTANSIFVAATLLLFKELFSVCTGLLFLIGFLAVCIVGCLIALQMAIALSRFSAQNALIGWRIRSIERGFDNERVKILTDIWAFREKRKSFHDSDNDPQCFKPNRAIRIHRKRWAIRAKLLPWLFLAVYSLCMICGVIGYLCN